MKFLRDKIDQIKKPFEKGQKFEKYAIHLPFAREDSPGLIAECISPS